MELTQVSPDAVTLWRLAGVLRSGFTTVMLVVPAGVALKVATELSAWVAVGIVLAAAALLVIQAIAWPGLTWRYLGYGVRDHDLLLQRGVLFRRRTSVPLNRIQHVDTHQGPLERFFGLSSLLVYTASTMSADAVIPGLDEQTAESLRDELARRGGDDGV